MQLLKQDLAQRIITDDVSKRNIIRIFCLKSCRHQMLYAATSGDIFASKKCHILKHDLKDNLILNKVLLKSVQYMPVK